MQCFFYGAFAAKVLLVHSRRLPGWALPVAGGTLALVVGVLWYTSALWYYNGCQLRLLARRRSPGSRPAGPARQEREPTLGGAGKG
jgi:hypothetical protein